jgi:hypothetical protein
MVSRQVCSCFVFSSNLSMNVHWREKLYLIFLVRFISISKLHYTTPFPNSVTTIPIQHHYPYFPSFISLIHHIKLNSPISAKKCVKRWQEQSTGKRQKFGASHPCLLLLDTRSDTISSNRITCGASASASASLLRSAELEWVAMEVIEFWSSISPVSEFVNRYSFPHQ